MCGYARREHACEDMGGMTEKKRRRLAMGGENTGQLETMGQRRGRTYVKGHGKRKCE